MSPTNSSKRGVSFINYPNQSYMRNLVEEDVMSLSNEPSGISSHKKEFGTLAIRNKKVK